MMAAFTAPVEDGRALLAVRLFLDHGKDLL
jgi:hypothetical protein